MPWIKNVEVRPVGGGSIVQYDYLDRGSDSLDHMHVLSSPRVVFTEDKKAIEFARALTNNKTNLDFFLSRTYFIIKAEPNAPLNIVKAIKKRLRI